MDNGEEFVKVAFSPIVILNVFRTFVVDTFITFEIVLDSYSLLIHNVHLEKVDGFKVFFYLMSIKSD